jgi:hypothetical protein
MIEKLPKVTLAIIAIILVISGFVVTFYALKFNNIFAIMSAQDFDTTGAWILIFIFVIAGVYFLDIGFKLLKGL